MTSPKADLARLAAQVEPVEYETVDDPRGYCTTCGWPAIEICCNGPLATTEPYAGSDWWLYCSNPTCEHHAPGDSMWQDDPDWFRPYVNTP